MPRSRVRPSKKLLDNVRKVVLDNGQYSLLNEQLVAKNLIWAKIRKSVNEDKKSVVLVGGPGTGKSVIALNLLAEVAKRRHTALYVCKSKPFREGLQKLVGSKAKNLFVNSYFLVPAKAEECGLDVVLIDEAHRLEQKNVHRGICPGIISLICLPWTRLSCQQRQVFSLSTTSRMSGTRSSAVLPE
ncbi:MAG: DUF2075 domain-containing protein [Bacteroidales bacterium]|nr:DUF2075 domain-containing protein [Bacteroidales bacterium]